ncbi:PE domain-containing protein [Amycolatopsis saalfeldensis]|nr:PE domain-containing protein [Amycolatopsis saalfeldensis]
MPDGQGGQAGGLNGVYQQNVTPPPPPPPPGSPPLPLSSGGPVTTTGQPPDYKALGTAQAKADFAAAANSGGWEFDPDAMDKVIQKLEGLLDDDLDEAQRHAQVIMQIRPPGGENVSNSFANAAIQSANQYNGFLQGAVNFLMSYVDVLKQVKTAYEKQDHAAIDALRGSGKAD